jgi:hypothetical protein
MRYESFRAMRLRSLHHGSAACCGVLLLLGLTFAVGCGDAPKKPTDKAGHHEGDGHKDGEAGHAHAEHGPHGGQLIELGKEEYHGELLHDDAAHKITIYLLDGAAKKSVAIADQELTLNIVVEGKPLQFKLQAAPQTDDPAGQSSRFELVDHALCEALDAPKSKGRLNVTIAGKPYSGEVGHEAHEHH